MPKLVAVLDRLKAREVSQDYTYYGLASPWLQVKCLRVLQYFPPPEEPGVRRQLVEIVKRILSGARRCCRWQRGWQGCCGGAPACCRRCRTRSLATSPSLGLLPLATPPLARSSC